jgi:hypothetical protein
LQRRWQDGCRIWPLLARGFGYTLDVVPGAVCTTARWTCQALIHVRAKLHCAYARHGSKEQTLAAPKASARIVRRRACRPPGWRARGGRIAAQPARSARPGPPAACPNKSGAAASAGSARPAASGSAAAPGRRHPAGAGAILPFGSPADRDHGRVHVRGPDRRVHHPAWFAPGVSFLREARNPNP